jgi:tRNA-splicing ligase RtcB
MYRGIGQPVIIPGDMGRASWVLAGQSGSMEQTFGTACHGAGRVMSRTQAAGRMRRRKLYKCQHRDCERLFDIDGVSSHLGPPRRGVCPDHPEARVKKVWVEQQVKPGVVDWQAVQSRLREQGIVLVGGGADEAPEVYKRLPDVLAAHAGSVRVKHRLRPLGVAMAGHDVYDPYKDLARGRPPPLTDFPQSARPRGG